ncbi:YicC family protein [Alphaproteobacteria bacterium]|nr:YicC family protein [Alphaproteobacteria bacterium]
MVVSSMTGFARADGEYADWQWSWETKSVNNKALDVRVRMPSGHDRLELPSRQAASKRFKRGSVNMVLSLAHASMGEDKNKYEVNENLLNQLLAAAKEHSNTGVQNIETLLTIRGVVDKVDEAESETDQAQRHASILKCLDEALDALLLNRQLEGQKLHSILSAQLDEIKDCVRNAASAESLRPELRKQRLQIQLREVLEAEPPVTEDRLAQELAILLIKGDITEELDRLKAHVSSACDLLSEGGAIGRRLDFLCQELNREANTVCSKSNDNTLTKHGLELKVLIEQFREQVQNVE